MQSFSSPSRCHTWASEIKNIWHNFRSAIHHHLPYSTGHFFSVLRTGLYASSPEPHECHGNGNGQANIECYISLSLAPSSSPLTPYAFPSPLISPPAPPPPPPTSRYGKPFGKPGYGPDTPPPPPSPCDICWPAKRCMSRLVSPMATGSYYVTPPPPPAPPPHPPPPISAPPPPYCHIGAERSNVRALPDPPPFHIWRCEQGRRRR